MDDSQAVLPAAAAPVPSSALVSPRLPLPRWAAALEAVLVCGIPTQVVIAAVLVLGAQVPFMNQNGQIPLEFFSLVSLLDTAVIALLIRLFLWLSDEDPTQLFIGRRPVLGEVLRGLALVPVVLLAVAGVVLALQNHCAVDSHRRAQSTRGVHGDANRGRRLHVRGDPRRRRS